MNSWCLFCHLALWDHLIFSPFGSQGGFNYSVTLGISGCSHWTWSSIGTLLSFWKCWLSSQDYFRFFIISFIFFFFYFYFNFFLLFFFFSFSNSFFWFFHLSKTTFSWSTKFLSWVTPCVWAQEKQQQQTEDTFAPYLWPTKEEVSPVLLVLMGNRKTKGGHFYNHGLNTKMDADWIFLCRTRGDSSVPKGVLLLLLPGKIKRWWKIKDIIFIIIYIYIDISCWFTVAAAILPWLWFVDSDLLNTTGLHQETDWFTSLMF